MAKAKASKVYSKSEKIVLGKRKKLRGKRLKFFHENNNSMKSKRKSNMPKR